jgi:hypothetical protein
MALAVVLIVSDQEVNSYENNRIYVIAGRNLWLGSS